MKCIEDCGYKSKPDNLDVLKSHLEECLRSGASRRLKKDPVIIWKDGEFTVAEKATKKDRVFNVELVKKEPIQLTDDMIKKPSDYITEPTGVNQESLTAAKRKKKPATKKADLSNKD